MAPKRSASGTDSPPSRPRVQKRTRFASPGDNPANFAEEVDAALEDPMRKGRIRTEGYESDSTDDGEGVVESRKGGKKEQADGDEDMFAEEDVEDAAGGKKKKGQEFMRLGDIEGQEFGDDRASEDDLSDEPEDEDDAERRKKAGMGFELSSFNMREEMEEGKFDADGTFIRTYDAHAVHDRWMEGLDERVIKRARQQKKARERQERERQEREDREAVSREDAERELVACIQKGETVLEALQRLGAVGKKMKGKIGQRHSKKHANGMDVDAHVDMDVMSPIQEAIARITDLASVLMSHGNTDIYTFTYEQLLRSVRSRGDVDPTWVPASQQAQYEYRWAVEGGSEDIYGPYSREEVLAWYGAHYFGEEGEKIRIRKVGDNNWHEWDEVIF